jgi:hypothetical protein
MKPLPPAAKQHFAKQHMSDAAKVVATVVEAGRKDSDESRLAYERFHNNLALFSGGTIALSVTYLGYLKAHVPIIHPKYLIASWIALMICVAASLFFNFFNTHYGQYFRDREYWEAVKKKLETEANEVEHLGLSNLRTAAELEAFRGPRLQGAAMSAGNAKSSQRRETFYSHFSKWLGRLGRLAFLVGMALLLIFAISNT